MRRPLVIASRWHLPAPSSGLSGLWHPSFPKGSNLISLFKWCSLNWISRAWVTSAKVPHFLLCWVTNGAVQPTGGDTAVAIMTPWLVWALGPQFTESLYKGRPPISDNEPDRHITCSGLLFKVEKHSLYEKKKNVLRHYGGCQCVAIQWLKCSECVLECSYADVWVLWVIARAILKSLLYSPKKRHKSCHWGGTLSKDQGFTKPVIILFLRV